MFGALGVMENCGASCDCADCVMKAQTLGILGWLPNGFNGLAAPEPTQVRALSAGGLVLNGLILAGGVGLWRSKHRGWGGLLVFLGGTGLAWNIAGVVTGKSALERS